MADYSTYTQEELNEKFFDAIKLEDLAGAQELLTAGADLDARTTKGNNGLFVAVTRNKRKSFAWLLKQGINPNVQDTLGETVAMHLAQNDRLDYLKHLLTYKNVNLDLANTYGVTALHYATMYSHIDCAKSLMDAGAQINTVTIQDSTPLLAAAQNHCFDIFEDIVNRGGNVKDLDTYKKDVLMNAVSNPAQTMKKEELESLQKIVDLAIAKGADPSYKAPSGLTPIFAAMMYGQKTAVKALLDAGANPAVSHNIMTTDQITPLHLAFEMGDAETATLILDKATSTGSNSKAALMNAKNSDGNTPAAFGFFHQTTRQLALDSEGDVNAVLNVSGQKMPVVAVIINAADETSFDAMVSRGVKLNFTDPEFAHIQPIKLAIAIGVPGMVEKVIKYGNINLNETILVGEKKKITPLSYLVANSQAQILETFLQQKKVIQGLLNQKLGDGTDAYRLPEETRKELQGQLDKYKNIETELKQNKEIIFDMLIKNGADINHKDANGRSALFYVADIEYVDFLLKSGADFFQVDEDGNNPLSWAIKNARTDLIDKHLQYVIDNDLIDRPEIQNILVDMVYTGPDGYHSQGLFMKGLSHAVQEGSGLLNNTDVDGNTALIVACATEQAPVAALLLAKGADVNLANNAGETPLMHAVSHGYEDLVKGLIDKGADVNAQTVDGKTVLDFATEVQNKDIISWIMKKQDPSIRISSDKVRIN